MKEASTCSKQTCNGSFATPSTITPVLPPRKRPSSSSPTSAFVIATVSSCNCLGHCLHTFTNMVDIHPPSTINIHSTSDSVIDSIHILVRLCQKRAKQVSEVPQNRTTPTLIMTQKPSNASVHAPVARFNFPSASTSPTMSSLPSKNHPRLCLRTPRHLHLLPSFLLLCVTHHESTVFDSQSLPSSLLGSLSPFFLFVHTSTFAASSLSSSGSSMCQFRHSSPR